MTPARKRTWPAWCKNTGYELVAHSADDTTYKYTVRRSR